MQEVNEIAAYAFKGLVALTVMVLGYNAKTMRTDIDKTKTALDYHKDNLAEFEIEVSKNYVTKDDLRELKGEMKQYLDKEFGHITAYLNDIGKKLDNKEDKKPRS